MKKTKEEALDLEEERSRTGIGIGLGMRGEGPTMGDARIRKSTNLIWRYLGEGFFESERELNVSE